MKELTDNLRNTLCDSAIENNFNDDKNNIDSSPEFFEFIAGNRNSDTMCPADDIIICGKLVPFKGHKTVPNIEERIPCRTRSESLSELRFSPSRTNRVLNSRKVRKLSSSNINVTTESFIERNPSMKSVSDDVLFRKSRPWWHVFMLGTLRVPTEMELKDIKSRQVRRVPSVMVPSLDVRKGFSVNRSWISGKGPWKVVTALSCKDYTSVCVASSFGLTTQVHKSA